MSSLKVDGLVISPQDVDEYVRASDRINFSSIDTSTYGFYLDSGVTNELAYVAPEFMKRRSAAVPFAATKQACSSDKPFRSLFDIISLHSPVHGREMGANAGREQLKLAHDLMQKSELTPQWNEKTFEETLERLARLPLGPTTHVCSVTESGSKPSSPKPAVTSERSRSGLADEGDIVLLINLLSDEESQTRRSAVGSIAALSSNAAHRIHVGRAIPPLVNLLDDSDMKTRKYAMQAIYHLSECPELCELIRTCPQTVARLTAIVGSDDVDADVKRDAALSLANITQHAEECRVQVVEAGGLEYLGALLSSKATSARTRDAAHKCLQNIAENVFFTEQAEAILGQPTSTAALTR